MMIHATISVLLAICGAESVSGNQVYWLLMPTKASVSSPIFTPQAYQTPSLLSSNGFISHDSSTVKNGPRYSYFVQTGHSNDDHDQSYSQPAYHHQYTLLPPAPIFLTNHGSGRWQKYNDNSNKRKDSDGNKDNSVIVIHSAVGKEEDEDYNAADTSSASVSTEIGTTKRLSMIHHYHPAHSSAGPGAVLVDNRELITGSGSAGSRCILDGNHQARYDPLTGGCYTVGTKGPCGEFMIFTPMPNNNLNGYCDCDYDSFDRPMALVGGRCHFLYSQAICYPGYWLTSVTPDSEPVCQENPCHRVISHPVYNVPSNSIMSISPKSIVAATHDRGDDDENSIIVFKGECTRLNTPSPHCRRAGEVVLFPKGGTQPACGFPKSTKRIYRRQISNVSRFPCAPGMRRNRVTKRCVRTRAIKFH